MQISNIAVGDFGGAYHKVGDTSSNTTNTIEINGVNAYRTPSQKQIYINSDPTQTTDQSTHPLGQYGGLSGIYVGSNCLTTKISDNPTVVGYTYSSKPIDINQVGISGKAFQNCVSNNKKVVWGVECIFSVTSTSSASSIINYGYGTSITSPKAYLAYYNIYVDSDKYVKCKRQFYTENGTWSTTYNNKLSTSTIDANKWYHLCCLRIGDGQSSHGNYTGGTTLVLLEKVADTVSDLARGLQSVKYYLKDVKYENGTWNYNGVLSFYGASTSYGYGSPTDKSINLHSLNENGRIAFADKFYLQGGGAVQKTLYWDITNGTTTFYAGDTPTFANSTLKIDNTAITPSNKQLSGLSEYYTWTNSI